MSLQTYAIAGLVALTLISGTWLHGDRNGAARVQARFDAFKDDTRATGLKAAAAALAQAADWERKFREQEEQHVKTQADDTARFARELARLRAQPTRAGGDGMSAVTNPIGVCADAAGNDRLSNALRDFEIDVVRSLETCQRQTNALILCQGELRILTTTQPQERP